MAFHSTSERYQYIYGSNVTKLDQKESRAYEAESPRKSRKQSKEKKREANWNKKNLEKEAAIQKNKEKLFAFDWKYAFITGVAVIVCAVAALVYVGGTVQLNALSTQVSQLKTEKAELLSKQAALQTEIDKSINLDEIRTFAEEKLHMTYPDEGHVIYYNDNTSDYFRQYESVDAVK